MDSPLVCLVYASRGVRPLTEPDLQALLDQARGNNVRLGISGVLIYGGERFVQVLEGTDEAVHEVFSRIATDRRHYAVRILADEPIAVRVFGEWSMGLRRAGRGVLEGFDSRLAEALERAEAQTDGKAAIEDLLPIVADLVDGSTT